MAKAKAKPREKKTEPAQGFTIPVLYGNVNIGDETVRVGIRIDRKDMSLARVDANLIGKRLTGNLVSEPGKARTDQPGLMDARDVIEGVSFDVKSCGVTRKSYVTGITLVLGSVDVSELAKFAKRAGKLEITSAQDIPKDEGGGDAEEEPEDEDG